MNDIRCFDYPSRRHSQWNPPPVRGRTDAQEAGTDKTRILHVQMWLDDIRDFDEVNAVWDAWMPKSTCRPVLLAGARWPNPTCWSN